MSELQVESKPQPSAPPSVTIGGDAPSATPFESTPVTPAETPAADPSPAAAEGAAPTTPEAVAPETPAVPQETTAVSDDWRKAMAGDDVALLTELSRFKTQQDVAKQLVEQKKALSKRATGGAFPADGDAESQQAWREANGVPSEGTTKAYEIKAPDGYAMSEVEQGMLDEYVKDLHGANAPKALVQKSIDKWFSMNAANEQAMRQIDEDRHTTWVAAAQQELGKDFEPIVAAANAFIEQRITDDAQRNEMLNARMPGGGIIAKHPEFLKLVGDLALQNGYGDRLEANAMESGGKSLGEQQMELEGLRTKNPELYNAPATQAKLDRIIGLRLNRGEIDELGNAVKRR